MLSQVFVTSFLKSILTTGNHRTLTGAEIFVRPVLIFRRLEILKKLQAILLPNELLILDEKAHFKLADF